MQLIDTHTHLTAEVYANMLDDLLARARQEHVDRWITIGSNLPDSTAGIELCKQYPGLYCSVGIHPHEAGHQDDNYLEQLRTLAGEQKVLAIGEIGLDYHYEFAPRQRQIMIFQQQLELAGELALPVIVHCREALEDCLEILHQWQREDVPVVFHCFGGDKNQAGMLIDRGYFISFTGMITFDNARTVQQTAQYVPLERIMLETDCPYLSPEPHRNVKPNEPALMVHTAEKLAQLKGTRIEEIAQVTTDNSRLFFGID